MKFGKKGVQDRDMKLTCSTIRIKSGERAFLILPVSKGLVEPLQNMADTKIPAENASECFIFLQRDIYS